MFLKLAREAFGREQASIQGTWREREQAFQALVDPIRSALEKTEAQVSAMERERREAFVSLRTQIETLAQGHSALQRETRNLVTALRRPEVRGRWGELTLAARGGTRRPVRALRFHRAAEPRRGRRPVAPRSGGEPARRAQAGGGRQDAARGLSRCDRCSDRGAACAGARAPRAAGRGAGARTGLQGLLGAVRAQPGIRRAVPAGRSVPEHGAGRAARAARARVAHRSHRRHAVDVDRAAQGGRLWLAASRRGRERRA